MKIKFTHAVSKIQSIVDGISHGILQEELKEGDNLPSVNELSSSCKVSRDTVFKAYQILKSKGVIEATPTKGYFVRGQINRTLLILDTYTSFKLNLYHRFIENLPENHKVELIFHQYNENLLKTIIHESLGKYNTYIVMNPSNECLSDALKVIPENKLLLLDFGGFDKENISFICQNFNESFYDCLMDEMDNIRKYNHFSLIYPENSCHPAVIKNSFTNLCRDAQIEASVCDGISKDFIITKGTLYLCVSSDIMVDLLKLAKQNQLECGKDYGMIAYNDEPVLEVIENGISAITVDFGLMGELSAKFVVNKNPVREFLPTKMIKRNSF